MLISRHHFWFLLLVLLLQFIFQSQNLSQYIPLANKLPDTYDLCSKVSRSRTDCIRGRIPFFASSPLIRLRGGEMKKPDSKSVPGFNIVNGKWTTEDAGSEQSDDTFAQDAANQGLVQHKSVMTADKCIAMAVTAMEQNDFEEAINLLNVAVAEKIQEFGQRSVHCIEGYLLFARAIISLLAAEEKDSTNQSKKRNFDKDQLERIPVWSSSSSSEDNSACAVSDADDESEGRFPSAQKQGASVTASVDKKADASAIEVGSKGIDRMEESDASSEQLSAKNGDLEECPERDLWRLLRRSEEILKSELSLPQADQSGSHAAAQLAKVQDLLRWFHVSDQAVVEASTSRVVQPP